MNTYFVRNRLIILAYVALLVLLLVAAVISPGFLSGSNMRSVTVLAAFVGIAALGQTMVIIGGGIDLSVPWIITSAAMMMAILAGGSDAALVWVIPAVIAGGALVGLTSGIGIAYFNVPPIIMTLAANVILQGIMLVTTGGSPSPIAPDLVRFFATGRIGAIPVIAVIWTVLALAAILLLSRSSFGRYLYAVGTNATVAEHSGIPVARTRILTYVISGASGAVAGILLAGYSGQAYLGMGETYLFTSIAAVAIGGASILGGSGHYVGTIAGAMLLTVLSGLLPALNLSNGALLIVYGTAILITVSIGSESISRWFLPWRLPLFRGRSPAEPQP